MVGRATPHSFYKKTTIFPTSLISMFYLPVQIKTGKYFFLSNIHEEQCKQTLCAVKLLCRCSPILKLKSVSCQLTIVHPKTLPS